MSFPVVCPSCGAPSGPSTGICPFCKSIFATSPAAGPASAQAAQVERAYQEGNLSQALSLCDAVSTNDPKALENVAFLMDYVKILFECEGPSSKIKSLLGKAFTLAPQNPQIIDYLDLIEAKSLLTRDRNGTGERKLADLLRRSPNNVHALFLMGTNLYWGLGDVNGSARYLEKCVSLYPKFLRAWGCLGAIYEKLGNRPLAEKAYRYCSALETDSSMKAFFEQRLAVLNG